MSSRKDTKGRVLEKGESQRDNYYIYQYTDIHRKRRVIYAKDLPALRQKKAELLRDIQDKLDISQRATMTLNDAFDCYFATRTDLKHASRINYKYLYEHYVREGFGTWKLANLCYSDFKAFYLSLAEEYGLSKKTLFLIHSILSQVMKTAVRDNILRGNPAEGVVQELAKKYGWEETKRHALTPEEQSRFISYAATHPEFEEFTPLLIVLLGTGCRIGEALGLRWKEDVDFDSECIRITHSLQYRRLDSGTTGYYISTPKTIAGKRIIPMLSQVREALSSQKRMQDGWRRKRNNPKSPSVKFQNMVVDGYKNFVFTNPRGGLYHATTVNRAIKRIIQNCNQEEILLAKQKKRPPQLLPDISCHHLRHTFCSRLCENETNLKVIQDIMGHANISTTMNLYAEVNEKKKAEHMHQLEGKIFDADYIESVSNFASEKCKPNQRKSKENRINTEVPEVAVTNER